MKKLIKVLIFMIFISSTVGCSDSEVEPEPEEVKVEEDKEKIGSSSEELSTDLYSFQVSVNDVVYQFPMSYDDFESLGWEYKEDENESLESGSYLTAQYAELDDFEVFVDVINFSPETRDVKDSYIGGMVFEKYYIKDADVEIILPGDISFNKSTLEEIETAYGQPSDVHEAELFTKYSYGEDMYKEVQLTVSKDTEVLEKIEIRNFAEPDDLEKAEIVRDTPEQISNYKYPESLGDDLFDYNIEYDGVNYKMPIPVTKLLENGWKDLESEEQTLPSNGFSSIDLMKNNQTVHCFIENYFDFLTITDNTHITKIDSKVEGPEVPIKLPHDITLGMGKEDFVKAISNYEYKVEVDDYNSNEYYRIEDPDLVNSGYSIRIDKDTNSVGSIEINCGPKDLY